MDTWPRYFCRKCPYEAFVNWGDDVGMAVTTSTVRRYDCQEIKDVVTTEEPWVGADEVLGTATLDGSVRLVEDIRYFFRGLR